MASLNGPGFSITLLKADWELLRYLDVPTSAAGWPIPYISPDGRNATGRVIDTQSTATKGEKGVISSSSAKGKPSTSLTRHKAF
jgi:dihydroxyacetone kinase